MSITGVVPPVDVMRSVVPLTLLTVPAVVAKVPDVGNVTVVIPVIVKVEANAPLVVNEPPSVMVDAPLFTPVPPLADGNIPVTPEVNGSPVQLVNTPDVGVPSKGVVNVGDVERTTEPVPVDVVTPVPPLATATVVPVQTPVVMVPNVVMDD